MKRIIFAVALLSAPALAQQQMQMPDLEEVFFKQFDGDQDGRVTKTEFLKPTEAQFDHMDRDKDGALDRSEVKAFNDEMEQRMKEMEQRMKEMQQRMQQQGGPQGMPRR